MRPAHALVAVLLLLPPLVSGLRLPEPPDLPDHQGTRLGLGAGLDTLSVTSTSGARYTCRYAAGVVWQVPEVDGGVMITIRSGSPYTSSSVVAPDPVCDVSNEWVTTSTRDLWGEAMASGERVRERRFPPHLCGGAEDIAFEPGEEDEPPMYVWYRWSNWCSEGADFLSVRLWFSSSPTLPDVPLV